MPSPLTGLLELVLLRWRLIFGTLFVAALVALCWLDYHAARPGVYLWPLAIVVGLAGAGELLAMLARRDDCAKPRVADRPGRAGIVYGGVLLVVVAAGLPALLPAGLSSGPVGKLGWLAIGLAGAFILALIEELCRFDGPGHATASLAYSLLVITYIGGLVGFLVQLRLLGDTSGIVALASLIATVKMSDTGQYFVGRRFGRHKLSPTVSPGKTWEGVAGGVLFAVAGAGLVFWWADGEARPLAVLVYALALTAAGVVGDLSESLLKRDAGVKDSSEWMPGFGGVLDMLDSLLVAGPVAYLFWALGWVG